MDSTDKLVEVLGAFAQTLLTDSSIEGILDRLVEGAVELLPVTAAEVTLVADGVTAGAAAPDHQLTLELDQRHIEGGDRPTSTTQRARHAPRLTVSARHDRFVSDGPRDASAGTAEVVTIPLRHPHGRLGDLDLYCLEPRGLSSKDRRVAQTLADVAAAYLLNTWTHQASRATVADLRASVLHDGLTGLPNRLLLADRLVHAARRARRSGGVTAVLFADLDDFKAVNDAYGHQVGDELLVAVAHRLADVVRPGDTLARISGDEFVILCEDLARPSDVDALRRRIDAAFARPFRLTSQVVQVSASIGIAYAGRGEDVSDAVVARADAAMYDVKRRRSLDLTTVDLRDATATTPPAVPAARQRTP